MKSYFKVSQYFLMTSPSFRLYVVMRFEVWRIKNLIEAEISVCWLNWIWTSRPLPKGAFTNYVYMICLFLTTYPPSVYIFYGIKVYKKSIFLTAYPPPLVNVVCERPLRQIFSNNWFQSKRNFEFVYSMLHDWKLYYSSYTCRQKKVTWVLWPFAITMHSGVPLLLWLCWGGELHKLEFIKILIFV